MLFREAAAAGDPRALPELAAWLNRQPGREADVEAAWREAAAAGNRQARHELAAWLTQQPGREIDAEAVWREAAAAGSRLALSELVELLNRSGRTSEANLILRFGLDLSGRTAGHPRRSKSTT